MSLPQFPHLWNGNNKSNFMEVLYGLDSKLWGKIRDSSIEKNDENVKDW